MPEAPFKTYRSMKVTGSEAGDTALASSLEGLHQETLNGTNICDPNYSEYVLIYDGEKEWDTRLLWQPATGFNPIAHIIDRGVSYEAGESVVPVIDPVERSDRPAAMLAEMMATFRWDKPAHIKMRARGIKVRKMAGTMFPQVFWNPITQDVCTRIADPRSISLTSYVDNEDEVTEYFRRVHMTPDEVQEHFEGAPDFTDAEDSSGDENDYDAQPAPDGTVTVVYGDWRYRSRMEERVRKAGGSKLLNSWPATAWRRGAYCRGVMLQLRQLNRAMPFGAVTANYDLPDALVGMGEIRNLWKMQRELRRLLDSMLNHAYLTGNAMLLVGADTSVQFRKIVSTPGMMIPVGSRVADVTKLIAYLQPPTVPPYMQWLFMTILSLMEKMAGLPDVSQGVRPSGVISGRAIQALQGAAAVFPQQAMLNTKIGWSQVLKAELDLMWRHYSEERIIRITGEKGRELMAAIAQQHLDDHKVVTVVQKTDVKGDEFSARLKVNFKELMKNAGEWDYSVKTGQPLIASRQEKEAKAGGYVKLGMLHRSVALRFAGFDDATIADNEEAFAAEEEMKAKLEAQKQAAGAMAQGVAGQPGQQGIVPSPEKMDRVAFAEAGRQGAPAAA